MCPWSSDSNLLPLEVDDGCGFTPKRGTFLDPASKIIIGYDNIFLYAGTFTDGSTERVKDFDMQAFLDGRMPDMEGGSVFLQRYVNKGRQHERDGRTVVSTQISVCYKLSLCAKFASPELFPS